MIYRRPQQGMTLIMALIMLVVLTLLALTSFNMGRSNMQVVANMQQRDEALAAARETIEEAISTKRLVDSPESVLANPCGALANTRCIDSNGDGKPDVTVTLAPKPTCVKAQVIRQAELDWDKSADRDCSVFGKQEFGTAVGKQGNSLCADSVWEVTATAVDQVTEASVTVVQGVAVRVDANDVLGSCP